ncbi:MAG TPA: farnesyl diphosphate synthase [Oculatellaceae cyanobacterium]
MHATELSPPNFDFNDYTQVRRSIIEERLRVYMQLREPQVLWDSMAYSVLSGGKRLRALLCIAAGEACCEAEPERSLEILLPCACAIEMIHAMSLIHDDLPALDNDDLRRGKPTNHKVYGEAIALLAGDALLMLALDTILEHTPTRVSREQILAVALELTRAAGAAGMVGGQVDDLRFTGQQNSADHIYIDESVLASIHRRKTGALIRFSAWSGAKLAGGSDKQVALISEFAEILGLAFQIADDLLDMTGDATTLGKTPGKDAASNKSTYVTILGEQESKRRLEALEQRGLTLMNDQCINQSSANALSALLTYAVHRKN